MNMIYHFRNMYHICYGNLGERDTLFFKKVC